LSSWRRDRAPRCVYAERVNGAALATAYREHLAALESGYAAVMAAEGLDALVLHSGAPHKRSEFDDQYWPLRVTPHFQHWLPLAEADCALLIRPGARPRLIWPRDLSFWEQPAPLEAQHWQDSFEIMRVADVEAVKRELPSGRVAFIGDDRARAASWGLPLPAANGLIARLDQLRTIKSAYEVACLGEANRRAAAGHQALAAAFASDGASELELHLCYLRATGQDDPETPYKNIVALGANAATLHHVSYRKQPASGVQAQSLLVDAGACYLGYCSDITRTYVKGSGAAASAFASLVASVERFQRRLCSEVSVGEKYEALHDRAHRDVAQSLRDAGVTQSSVDEAVSCGLTRAFFPHGLGHSLGLQCHDVGCALIKPRPDNPFLRNTTLIASGQCFTIEPGIYFIAPLLEKLRSEPAAANIDWALVAELAQLGGVRIEDDLVVGPDNAQHRNLTREVLP
jgi:Xaa-Pro dipeptidase